MASSLDKNAKSKNKPSSTKDFLMRLGVLGELLAFLWKQKLYWLIPMILTFLVVAVIIVAASSSPAGVFIYSQF